MSLSLYSFDDCSVLHQADIKIPEAFRKFFNHSSLYHKNFNNLKKVSDNLIKEGIKKYRFVPSNIETSIIKVGNELLSKCGHVQILGITFKSNVLMQLKDFINSTINEYATIEKDDNISDIKEIFRNNEKMLKKGTNIPEDDDMKIISGYRKHECEGKKYFITEDEHFWGYSDLILDNFSIHVIEEWKCDLINV